MSQEGQLEPIAGLVEDEDLLSFPCGPYTQAPNPHHYQLRTNRETKVMYSCGLSRTKGMATCHQNASTSPI